MPHLRVSGGFSIAPPKVPKFSVNWYKRGAIFSDPSIIGVGEAGTEVVAPIEKLQEYIAAVLTEFFEGSAPI